MVGDFKSREKIHQFLDLASGDWFSKCSSEFYIVKTVD